MSPKIEIRDNSDSPELLRITSDGRALTQKEDGTYLDITDVVADMVETLPKVVEQRAEMNQAMRLLAFETWWELVDKRALFYMDAEKVCQTAFLAGLEYSE